MNIESIAYAGGIALLLVFFSLVLGMAWCAHCTPEYLGKDERLSAADWVAGPARDLGEDAP